MVAVLREEIKDDTRSLYYACGGALIKPNVVLTTAHHVWKYQNSDSVKLVARLGEWDSKITTELFPHVDVYVKHIIYHPDFNHGNLHNDFALLILEEAAPLSLTVNTLCLPTGEYDYAGTDCVVTGWGKDKFSRDGKFQNVLKQVDLSAVSNNWCQQQLRTTRLGKRFILDDSLMCAGGEEGKDACKGDGGSPLACRSKDDPTQYVVVGLVAFGIGCGEDGIPGVYANINRYETLDWIYESMNQYLQ